MITHHYQITTISRETMVQKRLNQYGYDNETATEMHANGYEG